MSNGIDLVTPDSDGGDWEEADEVGLWDAATSGNLWFYDFLDFPFTQLDGNFHSFAPGEMRIKLI